MLCCLCSHWFRSYIQIVIKCNLYRYSLLHFPQLVVLLILRIIAGGKNRTLSRYDVKEFLVIRRILTRDSRPFKQTLLFGWTTLPQCFHGKSESHECLHIIKYKISMHIISPHWVGAGCWNLPWWKTTPRVLSCYRCWRPGDAGARASATKVLTEISHNIWFSATMSQLR